MISPKNLSLSDGKINVMVVILLSLYILVGMGVDLIAPSLPAISESLRTTHSFAQSLVSIYLLGYALICIFVGFLSDAWGRRKLLITALLIYAIGSVLPIIVPHESTLLVGRFLQGAGMGAMGVLVRTILSDVLSTKRLMSAGVLIGTLWSIGSITGPIIGGYLQYYFNWSAGFYFLAAFAIIAGIVIVLVVPETLANRRSLGLKHIATNFITVSSHRFFMGVLLVAGLAYSSLIAFNILGSFFIEKNLGYSSIFFGHAGLSLGIAFFLGTLTCKRLLKKFKATAFLPIIIGAAFVVSVIQLIFSYVYGSNPWVIIIPNDVLFFINGIIIPTLSGTAMTVFREKPHLSGTANSMLTLATILLTALMSALMSLMHQSSAVSISWVYIALMALSGIAYYGMVANRKDVDRPKEELAKGSTA